MLPINVQLGETVDFLVQNLLYIIVPLACCILPSLFEGRGSKQSYGTWETDSWYVTYNIQKAYDTIVKEVEDWRETAVLRKPSEKSIFSIFGKKNNPIIFAVDNEVSPRLYRLKDDVIGEIAFELMETESGGTSIKATYHQIFRPMIQDFKAKMPVKIPASRV